MESKFSFFPLTSSDSTHGEFKSSIEDDMKTYVKKHSSRNYSKEELERMNKECRGKHEGEDIDRFQ